MMVGGLRLIMESKGLILFVDDEELNRVLAQDILESIGYQSILASSGIEAINIFKNNREKIDIVILDFMMPEMDGKDTFIELKKIDENIKVILSSGYSETEDIQFMKEMGLTSIINKPYRIEDLNELLDSVLIT